MGCEACQDCGCDNITLPVITGPTGAAGATGSAGSNGTDGTAVLHNDTAQSTTTSASIALFSATKAYTLPSNTLSTNGSKLRLTAVFSTTNMTNTDLGTVEIFIGGSNYTSLAVPYQISNGASDYESYMKIVLDITRTSTTNLFINSDSYITNLGTNQALASYHFTDATNVVTDISANALLFEVRGSITSGPTLNCDQLTIEHLIK